MGDKTEELRVENATKITYHASKVFHNAWSMGRDTVYPGATIGLFAFNAESGNWELVTGLKDLQGNPVSNPQKSDTYGNVNFAGLKRNVEYKLVELDTGDPAVFPYKGIKDYRDVPPEKGNTTSIPDSALASYNVLTLTADETRENTNVTDFPKIEQVMVNANHWVQFHITKWLYHEPYPASASVSYEPSKANGDTLIDNAVFELYRVAIPEGLSSVGFPDTGFGVDYTEEPYIWKKINNYSSGTLYKPDGERLSGEFLTDPDQDITNRYVYLLKEKNPGPTGAVINPGFKYTFWHAEGTNFTIDSIVDDKGTFTPRSFTYEMDTVNSEDVVNDQPEGPGEGVIYLASIRIAKWQDSYNKETGHLTNNYTPLPNAKFRILVPGVATPLADLTVGLDSHYQEGTPPAIAQSGTFQLIPNSDGSFSLKDYETEETLSDDLTVEPFTFEYDGRTFSGYRLLVYVKEYEAPDGYAFYGGEEGFPMWLCFVNVLTTATGSSWVFNDAYYVRESDNIYPLAENQTGISMFITNATSGDYSVAYSDEDPGKYRIVNYPTENTMVTGFKYGYSPTAATIGATEAELDQLPDSAIDRLPLEGVVMRLQKKVDSGWKYWDYLADRETDNPSLAEIKTLRDGSFHFERGLPEGTYRLWETSLGNIQGNENYEMVYPEAHPRIFTVSKATVNLSIYNPKKVSLSITKQDATGQTLDGVTFKLGSLTAAKQGSRYVFANVQSGTYKLTETKAGYTSSYLQQYLRTLFPASPSAEEQAQLDQLIALVTNGTFIGYEYSYSGDETNSQAKLASISPSFLQDASSRRWRRATRTSASTVPTSGSSINPLTTSAERMKIL